MDGYWMPPMDHVVELGERYGITGHQEPVIREGDIGHLEHTMHELAHAILLQLPFERRKDLSELVAETLKMGGIDEQSEEPFAAINEVEAFAVESLVCKDLGIPITDVEIIDGLAMQVSQVLESDFVRRFIDVRDTGHIRAAADRLRDIVAPDGRPEQPGYTCGTAALWRRTVNDHEITVYQMALGNARLTISEPESGGCYYNAWCYQSDKNGSGLSKALIGGTEWNGEGEDPPGGWVRNPLSGRRRPGGDASKEYVWR